MSQGSQGPNMSPLSDQGQSTDRPTSGRGITHLSGSPWRPPRSGAVPGPGTQAFLLGERIEAPAATPFQLAPRLYLLDRDKPGVSPAAFGELPLHLMFHGTSETAARCPVQIWISEDIGRWFWELSIERDNDAVRARLTASGQTTAGKQSFAWASRDNWDLFGRNRLEPEDIAVVSESLFVTAP